MNTTYKLIIILISFSIFQFKAQKPNIGPVEELPCNNYVTNPNIDKFVGTWEGNFNGKHLKISLKKEKINLTSFANLGGYECRDILIGFHIFSENNIELENSFSFITTRAYDNKWTVVGSVYDNNEPNELKIILRHYSKKKSINVFITYLDATHIKITKTENTEGIKVNEPGKPPYDYNISIPSNIILTKQ